MKMLATQSWERWQLAGVLVFSFVKLAGWKPALPEIAGALLAEH